MIRLIKETTNGFMIKTISSEGTYYLIKSTTRNKSFWNKQVSYVNEFASKESAMNKLYKVLEKLPENAFYDEDTIFDIEDEEDLKLAKFSEFYITDSHGTVLEDISKEVKDYLLQDEKFLSGIFEEE